MKAILTTILAALTSVYSFSQTPSLPGAEPQTASILKVAKSEKTNLIYHDYTASDCSKYHKMKVAGIVLASVGAAMIMTGGIMVAADYRTVYVNDPNPGPGPRPLAPVRPLRAAGGAFVALGALSVGAGIPLAIIGGVKGHKYCSGGIPRGYLNLHGGENGSGMAYNF